MWWRRCLQQSTRSLRSSKNFSMRSSCKVIFLQFHFDISRQFILQFIRHFAAGAHSAFQRLSRPWLSCFSRFTDFVSSKSLSCLANHFHFPCVPDSLYPSSRRSLQDSVGRVDSCERWVVMLSCRSVHNVNVPWCVPEKNGSVHMIHNSLVDRLLLTLCDRRDHTVVS